MYLAFDKFWDENVAIIPIITSLFTCRCPSSYWLALLPALLQGRQPIY
jgi:hypothetical protein